MKRTGQLFLEDYKKMKKYMKLRDKFNNFSILKNFFNLLIELKRRDFVKKYGSEVSPGCTIKKAYFLHPLGIVIGRDAIIEDNVVIMSNVTFGALRADNYIGKQHVKRGTMIGTGARILGELTVGEDCIIGANSVVTKDIPDNSLVVGYNIIKDKKNKNYINLELLHSELNK
jgi:serine O-acetyltransferase